jgi:general stress protein YciG
MANTSKRGFASMDPGKQREIASKGGRAAHAKGTAHEFTSDEARVAGRKGGEAVSRDRAHMSAIGREGGHSRGRARQTPQIDQSSNIAASSPETSSERPSYIGQERATDRGGVFGEAERGAGGLSSSRNERSDEPTGFRNDRGSI